MRNEALAPHYSFSGVFFYEHFYRYDMFGKLTGTQFQFDQAGEKRIFGFVIPLHNLSTAFFLTDKNATASKAGSCVSD
jgi:hypothetical protein